MLVNFAGHTPVRRNIHKHPFPLRKRLLDGVFTQWLPRDGLSDMLRRSVRRRGKHSAQLIPAKRRQRDDHDPEQRRGGLPLQREQHQRDNNQHQHHDLTHHCPQMQAQQRRQPEAGGQHHQAQDRFKRVHPAARLRQQHGRFGHQGDKQPRQAHAHAEHQEDEPQGVQRRAKGKGNCGTEERCGARRGQQRSKHPFAETAAKPRPACRSQSPGSGRRQQHLKRSKQVQRKEEGHGNHQPDKPRVLELNAPAQGRPGQLQPGDHGGQQHKGGEDPGAGCQEAQPDDASVRTRLQNTVKLHSHHRQHARHQVEDQPAQQGKEHHFARPGWGGRLGGCSANGHRGLLCVTAIGQHK